MPANLTYYAGFSYRRLDPLTVTVSNDGGGRSYSATVSTGRYLHGLDDGERYDDHAAALAAALNAACAAAGGSPTNWTVAWRHEGVSGPLLGYRITSAAGAWAATLNATAQRILGMAASVSGQATRDSTVRPYYVIRCYRETYSPEGDVGDYEPEEIGEDFEGDDGSSFGLVRTTAPVHCDWRQSLEPLAATRREYATAAVPWTWQDFFAWCRNVEDFALVDSTSESIAWSTTHARGRFRLRADGMSFRPMREEPDRSVFHVIPIRARVWERFRE